LAHYSKKLKLWRLLKIEVSILKYRVPPHRPTYIRERRTTFAKAFGIKARCYWELFEEHVRNMGTLYFDHPHPQKPKKKKALHGK
jgi:hypothetical protein